MSQARNPSIGCIKEHERGQFYALAIRALRGWEIRFESRPDAVQKWQNKAGLMSNPSAARRAFTLTEILVVVGIIALLSAILFPVMGRAKESSRQARCASNLQQIYLAVRLYKEDERAYPFSIGAMMPASSKMVIASGGQPSKPNLGGPPDTNVGSTNGGGPSAPTDDDGFKTDISSGGTGTLKDTGVLLCPSDTVETVTIGSSYEMKHAAVWNFRGYGPLGYAASQTDAATLNSALRFTPGKPYNDVSNPIVNSLANRFAPSSTIITHCIYHRGATSNLSAPEKLYEGTQGAGARDVVLRLDGTTKTVDVSKFNTVESGAKGSLWQTQQF